jgi:hypothetical protein
VVLIFSKQSRDECRLCHGRGRRFLVPVWSVMMAAGLTPSHAESMLSKKETAAKTESNS